MLQQVGIREDIDDIVWVCQSAGFHDDVIAVTGLGQLSHGSVQLVLWRAAHTTATHLGHRQTRAVKNLAIDALGPELVHHHAHAQARGRGFPQPSQQQRGLARSQKTGDQNYRQTVFCGRGLFRGVAGIHAQAAANSGHSCTAIRMPAA